MPQVTLPDGTVADAVAVDFDPDDESWNEYELDDGSRLKVKLTLEGVYRVVDHYTELGEPLYVLKSDTRMRTLDVPEDLQSDVKTLSSNSDESVPQDRSFR